MVKAQSAEVLWDSQKKSWIVRIVVGGEVVRRPANNKKHDLDDGALRQLAVDTARDDGCEVAAETVVVKR